MADPILESKITAAITSFTANEKLDSPPSGVTVTAEITEGGTGTIKVTESLSAESLSRTMSFKIRSDADDGFEIVENTFSSNVTIGDAALQPYAGVIKNKLLAPTEIAWMKEAILKKAFTWNTDLKDERNNTSALQPGVSHNAMARLGVLQDHLQGGIDGDTDTLDTHLLIAGLLASLPADFFTVEEGYVYNTGIPWAELYFTKFLLEKAQAVYQASGSADANVVGLYDSSKTELDDVLKTREYEEFCAGRGVIGDAFTGGITHSAADEAQCDRYDAEVSLTDNSYGYDFDILMPPPFKVGSPTTLFAKAAGPITGTVIETAIVETPGILDRHREDVKRTAVIGVEITTDLMDDPEFVLALSKLTAALTANDGKPDTTQVSDIFNGLLIQTLTTGLGMSGTFITDNGAQIQTISTTFSGLLIKAASDPAFKKEMRTFAIDLLRMGADIMRDPRAKESVKAIVTESLVIAEDVLNDSEVQRQLDAISVVALQLAQDFMTANRAALVDVLSFGTRLGIEGTEVALSNPETAESREALVKSIVAMIALGQQEMTGVVMADPNLGPYIEKIDELMVLLQAYLEKKTKKGRVAPMPAQGPYHHQQEALLAGMDHWEKMKKLSIRGYDVEAQQLDKANGANLKDGHLRGETAIPDGLTPLDVITAMTSQTMHANVLTPDLKANILLTHDGHELDINTAPKDKFGNPCSFIDAQGNSHYIVFQYLTVDPLKLAYVIDLALIDTADAYILSWNRDTEKYQPFVDAQAAKGMKGGESSTNFGNWYVKKDGSAMGYSVCASGTGMLISAAPGRLAANVVDMAEFAIKQEVENQ